MSTSAPQTLARVFLALAAALLALPTLAAGPQLLRPVTTVVPKATARPIAAPGVPVTFDSDTMLSLRFGDEVQLTLPNGTTHDYIFELAQQHGGGISSWIGRHKTLGKEHRVIITKGPGGSYGVLSTPDREYRLIPAGTHDWLVDMTEEQLRIPLIDLGTDFLFPPPTAKALTGEPIHLPQTMVAIPGVNSVPVTKATPSPQHVVDLMVVYTNGLATNLGANLLTRINFLVTRANTSYADSEIGITLRLVNTTQVTYSDATDNATALNHISPASGSFNAAVFGGIETIRTSVGADLVALLMNGGSFSGSGIAWVGSSAPGSMAQYMYSVTKGCVAGCESVFIHELGHNMGNMHDRSTSSWQAGGTPTPPQGAFPYSYGYAFCLSGALSCNPTVPGGCASQPECSTNNVSNFSDIMAYFHATTERQYKFSNPAINCSTTGDATLRPCGISEAAGNSANSALSMNNNRAALSAVKPTMVGSTLQLAASTTAALESAGTMTFAVSRTGSSTGAVSVNYATSPGSALAGSDYTTTSGTLNWADGDTADKTFNVTLANDGATENSETFNVTLSNPSPAGGATGAVLGAQATATGLIVSPFPQGGIFPAGFVTPGGSSGAWTVVTDQAYEGANSLGSAKVVSPVFNTPVNSDMTFVGDFVTGRIAFAYRISSYQGYGTFEFSIDGVPTVTDAGGESGWKIVSVPITAGSRTLRWRFSNKLDAPCNSGWDPPPAGGGACADRVWIDALSLSNNPIPFLSFAQPTYSVTEGTPSVTIDVTRTVETAGAASVNYATANGTAIAGTHYTTTSGTFNWADADGSSRQIVVPITNDAIVNGSRTFTVNLSGAVGGNAGSPTTVTIADDDNTIQFASATATTVEGQPSVIVTVTRTGSTAFAASADWTTADGTALAGTDFGASGNTAQVTGTVSWAAGNNATQNISVPLLNDAIIEPTKTFTINLGNPTGTGASIGSIPTKTVTLSDDEAALSLSSATYTVNESGPNVTVTVNRTGATTNAIAVTWTTGNGTAAAGQDFGTSGNVTQRTGTLSWAAGDAAAKTFTVGPSAATMPILNDTVLEGDETFTITLSNPTNGAVLGATSAATVTIVDNESSFDFAPATLLVNEGGPNGALTVTRTGSTLTAASVTWTTSNGTALAGSDFGTSGSTTQRTGTLSWGAGDGAAKTISVGPTTTAGAWIPVLNDTAIEGPETLNVTLSAPTGGGLLGVATATVTIESNDSGVSMAGSTLSVAESAGTAAVQVNRMGNGSGAVSVNYATANGTATAGSHYTTSNGTLNWADGDTAPKTINVPILDNAAVNSSRTFTVTLSGPVGASLGTPTATTVTITDDDNTLQLSAATATVAEGTASVTLTVTRLGGTAAAASVDWATVNGTAVSGSDFGTLGVGTPVSGTLNWGAGDAASKTIVIPILNDVAVESTETFTVNLSGATGTGASVGTTPTATVTVTDDEASLNLSSATYTVNEAGPNATITVNRSGASAGAVSVTWTTGNGSAVAGQDFGTSGNPAQRTGTLSWAAGVTGAKTFTVGPTTATMPVLNDTAVEGDETFTITLSNPTGGAVLGPTSAATVTITDNDSTVGFAPTTLGVSEAGPNGTLTVTRTGSAATAATVKWTTSNGTALAGSDFGTTGSTVQKTGTLSWAAGDGSAKTISVGPTSTAGAWVGVLNDALIEGPETFNVTLSTPTGGMVLGAGATVAVVTITSDDRGVTMASSTQSVAESAGTVAVNVNRAGSSTGAVSVNYATANGTALAGTHYTTANGTLNWADGDTAPKVINVPITDNGAVNTARTFTVTLSGAVGATLGTPASTTVTISDDDNTLQFSAATATVAEGTATLNLSVTRLGGAAATASVDWASVDGTALSGSDFGAQGVPVPLTGTLNWGAGDAASKTIAIPILNDLVVEGAKTFTVNLSNVAGTGASIGTNATITVTINDNDAGVVLSAANYNVSETGATVTITANRIGPATAAATVTWTTSNGTATAGTDFGTSGSGVQRTGTLSWVAGNAAVKTFTIPILNDALAEGGESFNVTLSNPSAGIVLGTPSSATVTIVDDDIPPESTVQFTVGKTTVLESAATVDVTVSRTGGAYTFAGSVNYATAAGTALVTSDFTTRTGTLTWGSGDSTSRTITVPVTNDAVAESPEQFTVTLSAPTPGIGLGVPASTTVMIEDDDELFPLDGDFPAGWVMPGGANATWHVSNDPGPFEGALALRTDSIFDNEVAQVEIGGAWLAGTVSFRVKISSEPTFDVLRFLIDGVEAARWSGTANTTWQLFSVAVPAGAHTFRWSYEKDGSGSFGQDAAWLDSVTLPATP